MMSAFHRAVVAGLVLGTAILPLAGSVFAQPPPGTAHGPRKAVLVLYATRRGGVIEAVSDPVLRRILGDGLGGSFDYYAESLDILRADDRAYRNALSHFLEQKYENQTFDLFIAVGDPSLRFLSSLREGMGARATPLVFAAPTRMNAPPNATGIIVAPPFAGALEGALALHPDTTLVTVISGASPFDQGYETDARAAFKALEPRVKFKYLTGLPIADVLREVQHTPPHGILFLTTFAQDRDGQAFTTLDITDRLSKVANAPLYSWVNVNIGHGVVGGRMASQETLIARTGDLALRVLKGERADSIPVTDVDWTTTQFDWAQLRRWGIDEARLPPASQILFRPPTTWTQYGAYLMVGAAVLLLQAGFIVALLVQRSGRRKAEIALRASEAQFRLMADTAPVLIWRTGADGGNNFCNRPWLEFTGRTLEQELGSGWTAGVHPDDVQMALEKFHAAFQAREPFRIEFRLRRVDGEYRWLMNAGVPRYDDQQRFAGYVGSSVDVTDYRQAMEGFSESQRQQQHLAGKLIDAQERERTRIARELHDDINQQLAGLAIFQSGIRRRADLPAGGLGLAADLRFLQERTASVVESIRNISHGLHPVIIEHAGLVAALSAHCRELERNAGFAIHVEAEGDCDTLEPAARLCLYRVTQEALRNVVQHAAATRVTVQLRCDCDNAEVSIVDDGHGFDERSARRQADGLGLISIQERARLAGGTMCVVTEVGKGSKIKVRIPIGREAPVPV